MICILTRHTVQHAFAVKLTVHKNCFQCLSPNSDQHQISPCNFNTYITPEVMRIKDMITQGEFYSYFNNVSPVLLKEKQGDKRREFVL